MEIGEAGQAVQSSAFPDAYDDDVALATSLLEASGGAGAVEEAAYFGGMNTTSCGAQAYTGDVVHPLGAGASFVDQANYGRSGSHWESTHTGTDFAAGCGTPVVAATDGTVTVRTDASWSGPWLVQVDSGTVITWYAHMQQVDVTTGDTVIAGQSLGQVGTLGNSTGCHLHFEVRPHGGDPVDPTEWLTKNAGKHLPDTLPAADTTTPAVDHAVLITANIPFWLPDKAVAARVRQLLGENPDVLLLQEVGGRDIAGFAAAADGSWGIWQPDGRRSASAIVWNADKYAPARKGAAFGVRTRDYERWLPWVLLRGEAGTLPVVGLHLPTGSMQGPQMQAKYREMTANYLALLGEMNAAGYPPIVGGDWNHPLDRARESWSPVPTLKRAGMTTNWMGGPPCAATSTNRARIDGFAFNPDYVQVVDQGCLDRGPSDHRPVWIAVTPVG
jgi:hypothetical protein